MIWIIVGIVVVLLLIVTGVVVVVLIRSKPKLPSTNNPPTGNAYTPYTATSGIKSSYVLAPSSLGCPAGYDQPDGKGGLCYPTCRSGFHPFGCCTCTQNCPSGWGDTGTGCTKPAGYNRGVGTIPGYTCPSGYTNFGLTCTRDNGYYNYTWGCVGCHDGTNVCKNDCYKTWIAKLETISATPGCPAGYVNNDGLCYPAPRSGYTCTATTCTPNCPAGYNDIGLFCQKTTSYGRGAGTAPSICPDGQTQSGALCYPSCQAGYHNVAGVCWED